MRENAEKMQTKITLNTDTLHAVHISKTRTNLGLRLRFSEGSFNVLQNSVVFCVLYLR